MQPHSLAETARKSWACTALLSKTFGSFMVATPRSGALCPTQLQQPCHVTRAARTNHSSRAQTSSPTPLPALAGQQHLCLRRFGSLRSTQIPTPLTRPQPHAPQGLSSVDGGPLAHCSFPNKVCRSSVVTPRPPGTKALLCPKPSPGVSLRACLGWPYGPQGEHGPCPHSCLRTTPNCSLTRETMGL